MCQRHRDPFSPHLSRHRAPLGHGWTPATASGWVWGCSPTHSGPSGKPRGREWGGNSAPDSPQPGRGRAGAAAGPRAVSARRGDPTVRLALDLAGRGHDRTTGVRETGRVPYRCRSPKRLPFNEMMELIGELLKSSFKFNFSFLLSASW